MKQRNNITQNSQHYQECFFYEYLKQKADFVSIE